VISKDPLDEVVPLQRNNDGAVITQYYMEDVEAMGLLKMDFLGLKNLTMIQKTIDLVKETHGTEIDPDQIPMDDINAFGLLARGELGGIFQLESSGMRQIVRDLKPSGLDDISSVLALYRPGPLDAGLIPKFINRKHGREQIDYAHTLLQPILKETYGIMVFQEQIMKIAQDMAGYSLGSADLLRRAMGKKKIAEMEKHREIFIEGSKKNEVSPKLAEDLFEQMIKFAEYCFNKSHSMAYAYVTYQTAYLKANYPVEYMAALLSANSGDQDKVQIHIANCISMKIEVLPPNVNQSGLDFTPIGNSILFGFSAVRNVGQGAIEHLIEARQDGEFESLADLCDRVDSRVVNRRALEALIQSGAFDAIEPNRNQLMHDLDLVIDWAQARARDREIGQGNLFDMMMGGDGDSSSSASPLGGFESAPKASPVEDFPPQEKLRLEKELLGFYVSDHPLKSVQKASRVLAPISLGNLDEHPDNVTLSAIAMLTMVKPIVTKKGDRMAIIEMEDLTGKVEGVVFPKTFTRVGELILPDARLMIWGKIDRSRDDRTQMIVDDAEPVEEVQMVMVELDPKIASDIAQQHRLRNILRSHQDDSGNGKIPVVAVISANQRRQCVRLGAQFRVLDEQATVRALNENGFIARSSALCMATTG